MPVPFVLKSLETSIRITFAQSFCANCLSELKWTLLTITLASVKVVRVSSCALLRITFASTHHVAGFAVQRTFWTKTSNTDSQHYVKRNWRICVIIRLRCAVGWSFVGAIINRSRNNRTMAFTSAWAQFVIHEVCSVYDVVKRSAIVSAALNSAINRLGTSAIRLSIRANNRVSSL